MTTFLTFDDQAEEAANFYVSVFESGRVLNTTRAPAGAPGKQGRVFTVTLELFGQKLVALNGGPSFSFSSGFSLLVECETQQELDRYWEKLLAGGGKEVQCGWLTDRFGLSWQIIPKQLPELIGHPDPTKAGRAMQAMLKMKKLDVAALQRAVDGNE